MLTRIEMEANTSDFNPNSPKQLGTLLFDTMGLPTAKKTKNGWSTDAETLEKPGHPAGGGHSPVPCLPEAELHLCGGSAQRSLARMAASTPVFNQTEARTGRLSL